MDALKKEVTQICDQFMKEEMGNRLSQFSMMAFKGMLLSAIDRHEKGNVTPLKKEDKANA